MSTHRNDTALPSEPTRRSKMVALLLLVLVLGVLIGLGIARQFDDAQPLEAGILVDPEAAGGEDPFDVYTDALIMRMPIYVLFHSGGCLPCVEAEELAARVLPDYEGQVVYVSSHTVDPRSRPLFDEFSFRSVPTSFFLDAEGRIVEQDVGPLAEEELRERLDSILAAE